MPNPHLLTILADDLTGAADTGAPFAAAGLTTSIVLNAETPPDADVLVVTTNSRDLPADAAANLTRHAIHHWLTPASRMVYRKIDSALRGHPHAEVKAVMNVLGVQRVLVAPALPQQGRTTIDGRQLLDGVPLEDTSFGTIGVESNLLHIFDPDHTGQAIALPLHAVRQGSESISGFLEDVPAGIIVADAETAADLDNLAQAIIASNLTLLAGTAGLARSLATVLAESSHPSPEPPRATGSILIVAGSREDITARQVDHLRTNGTQVITLTTNHLDDPAMLQAEVITPLAETLATGNPAVVTSVGLESSTHGAAEIRAHLATVAATLAGTVPIGGLVLTGGDIAMGVLEKLEVSHIELGGEVRPALPWGIAHLGNGTSIPVATKAGSFGTEDALLACLVFLSTSSKVSGE